ncbi:MAG TPA: hypothetical protein VGI45_07720 [Terracidiphilus sp.]
MEQRRTRVYRMSIWIRSFAAAFLLFSVMGLMGLLWSQRAGMQGRSVAQLIEWAAIALFAAGWMAYVFSAAIVLSSNAIEKRTLLKTDRLRFDQILGRREKVHRNFDGSYIRYLQVIPRDALLGMIQFQKFYALDAGFYAWYDDLPDLDTSDRMRSGSSVPR